MCAVGFWLCLMFQLCVSIPPGIQGILGWEYELYKNNEAGSLEPRFTGEPNNRALSRRVVDNPWICTPNSGRRVVKALSAHYARAVTDISFRKGDRMDVLSDAEPGRWRVLHLTTRCEGMVHANFVVEDSPVECEDFVKRSDFVGICWFIPNMSLKKAHELLLTERNPRGTFLVRSDEHDPNGLMLSVKAWEYGTGYHVKHYKIKIRDNGEFYIATNQTFPSLVALALFYTKNALSFCNVLLAPVCPIPEPQDLEPELSDSWETPRNQIQLLQKLGEGTFGEIYYGKWRNSIEVAVKILRNGMKSKQALLQEADFMKKFRHKHLVALYAVCSTQRPIYIIQEYMSKGSLLEYLRSDDGRMLRFEDLLYIAAQLTSAMEYFESKLLIHRDLAGRNVLVHENNLVKISDFGLSRAVEVNEYCSKDSSLLPVQWTAPEVFRYGRFSIKSDVWSYGILLMELFTYGEVPYPGLNGKELREQVEKGYRMPKPVGYYLPDDIYRLMLQCWDAVPEKRPTFKFLNRYFKSFNKE